MVCATVIYKKLQLIFFAEMKCVEKMKCFAKIIIHNKRTVWGRKRRGFKAKYTQYRSVDARVFIIFLNFGTLVYTGIFDSLLIIITIIKNNTNKRRHFL